MFNSVRDALSRSFLVMLALAAGCGKSPAPSTPAGDTATKSSTLDGPNGYDFNGYDFNGYDFNGAQLLGVSVDGVRLNGDDITNVHLDGTALQGTDPRGAPLSACDFVGARLRGVLSDSTHLQLRIDGYDVSSDPEISRYTISYWSPSASDWKPLCGTDGGGPIKATALAGRWNYSQGVPGGGSYISDSSAFTFACDHSVLYKCTEMGYKPWKSAALANLHQACTRMMRADYCGDGTPYTVNGTLIDYFDWDGIATDDAPVEWLGDAEWTGSGASCIANLRHPELSQPPCYTRLRDLTCVDPSHFGENASLLMDKIQPR